MRRALLKFAPLYTRHSCFSSKPFKQNSLPSLFPLTKTTQSNLRFFSSDNDNSSNPNTEPTPETQITDPSKNDVPFGVEDVSNEDFKTMIEKYVNADNDEELPAIVEAVFKRRFVDNHGDTDDELIEELHDRPLVADDAPDEEIEDDFEEFCSTDEEIDNLYNTRDYVIKKLVKDKYFNMDDVKWKELLQDAVDNGAFKVTKECEDILEDMENWDKLLPDEIKKKVEEKYNELGDMCERGEIEPDAAYELFKEFEDQIVQEYQEITAAEKLPEEYETSLPDKKRESDDPPGEGPILRWQQRVVFAPGGDAWHPKNRKVKLSVTVKELGLSKHAFRRLRELVGKRYNSGKDELTITSERFEHREENRKDCMRTLLSLIEEAAKAQKLVEETRTSYVKERLKANPTFMERLRAKSRKTNSSQFVVPL